VLKITNGPLIGRIWIHEGEVIDAEMDPFTGTEAFQRIFGWREGSFESLPAEPTRTRTIFDSYQNLLLQTAQAHDESHSAGPTQASLQAPRPSSPLAQFPGVEFVLLMTGPNEKPMHFGAVEQPELTADWGRKMFAQFRALGEKLHAGPLQEMDAFAKDGNVSLAAQHDLQFCVGWKPDVEAEEMHKSTRKVIALWAS
jgi:hypothetical protein